jgi:two-component system sensor kinase FixL
MRGRDSPGFPASLLGQGAAPGNAGAQPGPGLLDPVSGEGQGRYPVLRWIGVAIPVIFGLIALAGWWSDHLYILDALTGDRRMQPLTAVGLILAGVGVASLSIGWRKIAVVGALGLILLGLLGFVQTVAGVSFGTDFLLFGQAVSDQRTAPAFPGRTSVVGCLLFVLLGVSSILATSGAGQSRLLAVICSFTGLLVAMLSIIGFLLLAGEPTKGADESILLPLHTALPISGACLAVLLLPESAPWTGWVIAEDWTGRTARLLLITAMVPIPVAWLATQGSNAGLYSTDVRLVLIVMGAVLLLSFLALQSASRLGRGRRTEDELASALDLSPNTVLSSDNTIVYWSQGCSELFGWTADEAEGRDYQQLLSAPGAEDQGPGTLPKSMSETGSSAWEGELQHRTKQGEPLTVLVRCVTAEGPRPNEPKKVLSMQNITKERQAQAQVLKREEDLSELQMQLLEVSRLSSMGELSAGLAHELNQPLTAVANFLGAVELALEGETPSLPLPQIRAAVLKAKEEALRGGEIVRRLRDFISRGEADTSCESVTTMVSDALQLSLPSSRRLSLEIRSDLADETDEVLADRVQIQQVLINLVRNAAEAMDGQTSPPPVITISSVAERDAVNIAVSDNGPGIDAKIAANLFTAFTSSKKTGMGIGLSICKRIIEAHGGKIWVAPTEQGTTFHFTLPRC